jgi:hypothetical protein
MTIGKIMLDAMKIAGIDITVFKYNSLRLASASALLDAGLTIEIRILEILPGFPEILPPCKGYQIS